jgi:hypothetical protein
MFNQGHVQALAAVASAQTAVGAIAGLSALSFLLSIFRKVRVPKQLARLANDSRVMKKVAEVVAYVANFHSLPDDKKREFARRLVKEKLESYLSEPVADHVANFLIELAWSRLRSKLQPQAGE